MIEYLGRLSSTSSRSRWGGTADLILTLHAERHDQAVLWEEPHHAVRVEADGSFALLLGSVRPLRGELFEDGALWLAVRLASQREEEAGARQPLTGRILRLEQAVEHLQQEGSAGERVEGLEQRLDELLSNDLEERLVDLARRLDGLDGEDGRLTRIEDELEDLVGPDGDVVDLNERMDRIEGQAPDLIASLRAREAELARERLHVIRRDLDQVGLALVELRERTQRLQQVQEELAHRPAPTAAQVGAVDRGGDTMSGGLVITRGGLEVQSGGITCRGANVNSLEATVQVKAPKVIADAIELRGDLTVDNSHRALQVRLVEGRQGSARKDGALFLNGRSGAEVVVGTAEEARGMQIHGPVGGGSFQAQDGGLAQVFDVYGSIEPGQVACYRGEDGRIEHARHRGDPAVIGVCVERAAFTGGGSTVGGRATVLLYGVTRVRASAAAGPIAVGTALVAGSTGLAEAARSEDPPAATLGKALSALEGGEGEVAVRVGAP